MRSRLLRVQTEHPTLSLSALEGWQAQAIQVLLEVAESVSAAGSVRDALHTLASLAVRATGADRCAILTPDPSDPSRLWPAAGASGVDDDLEELSQKFRRMDPIEIKTEALRLVLLGSSPLTLDDATSSPLIPDPWKEMWGSKSVAVTSLRAGGEVFGLLAVDYVRERHTFTTQDSQLLGAIASAAGAALRNARLVERLQHALLEEQGLATRNEALRRLSDLVVRTSDFRTIIAGLNSGVCRDVGVEFRRVVFSDPSLAALLRVKRAGDGDLELLRAWRTRGWSEPLMMDGEAVAPIVVAGRVTGALWMQPQAASESTVLEFAAAAAGALGEVAYKAKLRKTAERRSRDLAVAAERERIARDLHDTVGQTFFGIGLKLQDLLGQVEDVGLRERLAEVRGLAAQAVSDVRSAVYALSFLHVRARGLVPSLRQLTRQFTTATGIVAELRAIKILPPLSEEIEGALYRVVHEALVNVERHARATGVIVSLNPIDGKVELWVRDDGVGIDQRQVAEWRSAAHFGLRTMARAVEEVGGDFHISNVHPRGLHIRATVPARARAKARR